MELSQLCVTNILRVALIVCAGVIIVVSAITIGVIDRNKDINGIKNTRDIQSLQQLENLVSLTLAAAEWLIAFNVIVIIWEAIHIVLPFITSHFSLLQRFSIVLLITDAGFSCVAVVCSVASMIACIVYADLWGEPPEACDKYSRFYKALECDHVHLEGTNGAVALFCIGQVTLLLVLGAMSGLGGFPKILIFFQRMGGTGISNRDHERSEQSIYEE